MNFFYAIMVLFGGTISVFPTNLRGQSAAKMTYKQLQELASGHLHTPVVKRLFIAPLQKTTDPAPLSPVFLPRWSASDLPVFCRIEHEIGKYLPVMVKFRLGSVEYVDQLEGK